MIRTLVLIYRKDKALSPRGAGFHRSGERVCRRGTDPRKGGLPRSSKRVESVMNRVLKTSSIRIATARKEAYFRSVEELPSELKKEIKKALEGPDTETLYIANQAAYERIGELTWQRQDSESGVEEKQLFHRKRQALATLGALLSAAALTWVVLTLFDKRKPRQELGIEVRGLLRHHTTPEGYLRDLPHIDRAEKKRDLSLTRADLIDGKRRSHARS